MGTVENQVENKYVHYGSPRKRSEKWAENLFKEIMTEDFSYHERDLAI